MKKTLVLLLSVSLLLISLCACNDSTGTPNTPDNNIPVVQSTPETDFIFEENDEGGITIKRYIGQGKDVIIPDVIQNKPVTQIGIYAFVTNKITVADPSNVVVTLKMPDTVTIIGLGAFQDCDQLETVTLSNTLREIGAISFQGCKNLKHITIPSTVRRIADEAFESSGLESITFEEGIEDIHGYGAFACTKLKQIIFPSTLKETGHSSFAACSELESVTLNEGLVKIGHKSFAACQKLKEIVIPQTVETVTEMAFTNCSGLEKIKFDGNAPDTFEHSDSISGVWDPYNVHFTVYYHENAQGFTSPEWYGYPTEIW